MNLIYIEYPSIAVVLFIQELYMGKIQFLGRLCRFFCKDPIRLVREQRPLRAGHALRLGHEKKRKIKLKYKLN